LRTDGSSEGVYVILDRLNPHAILTGAGTGL
jgi:hypothetical protein